MLDPLHVLRTALLVSAPPRTPWIPLDVAGLRAPGRRRRPGKRYPRGYNKAHEMARRRRQMGLGEFAQLAAAA